MFLIKRKNQSCKKLLYNEIHFYLIAIALFLLSLKYPLFFILFFAYLFFILKKTNHLFLMLILILLVSLFLFLQRPQKYQLQNGEYHGIYEVIDKNQDSIVLKGEGKILIYQRDASFMIGDLLEATIKVKSFEEKSYETDFDERAYYASKRIYNKGILLSFKVIGHKPNFKRIVQMALEYYKKNLGEQTYQYVETLIFGKARMDSNLKDAYSTLYLSHILAISGMHILFIYKWLLLLFQKIFKIEGSFLSLLLIGGYIYLLGFPASAFRAFLFLLLGYINERRRLSFTRLDILSLSFIIMVLINPVSAYQTSFIMSYIVCFLLLFMNELCLGKNPILKYFISSLLCIFSVLPFSINFTNQIYPIGLLVSFIFSWFFSKYLLSFMMVVLIFPHHSYEQIILLLNSILLFFANFSFKISMPSLNVYKIVLYYIIYFMVLVGLARRRKVGRHILLCLFYLAILSSIRFMNPHLRVTFIDVGQGDSILIEFPFGQGTIVIDTYGDNVKYIKSVGITKIDYLILTHFDQDHIGSLSEILKELRVEKILYSKYEDVNKIESIPFENKYAVCSGDSFILDNTLFSILGPIYAYSDMNSNSIVLSFEWKEYRFLFTGDMTKIEELDLIKKYGSQLKSDILKVGHHGSKTSSCKEFLEIVRPKVSIISVGMDNSYQLPNEVVLAELKQYSKVWMTKDNGNIQIIIGNAIKVQSYR